MANASAYIVLATCGQSVEERPEHGLSFLFRAGERFLA